MNYVIYLDVFFIINLLMDFLILIIVRRLIHSKAKWFRSLIGAIIGAVYVCILIVLPFGNGLIAKIITYFFISYIMVRISYNMKGFRKNIKPYIFLFATTFLLGGILNALYFYTEFGNIIRNIVAGNIFNNISVLAFIIYTIAAYLIIRLFIYIVNKMKYKEQRLYNVTIELNNQIIMVKALLDTGNSLFDPISKKPVNIIEYNVLKETCKEINILQENFRMIPFHSVGKDSGLIPAISTTQMTIENEEEKIVVKKPMFGIYDKELSSTKEYQMILHPKSLIIRGE